MQIIINNTAIMIILAQKLEPNKPKQQGMFKLDHVKHAGQWPSGESTGQQEYENMSCMCPCLFSSCLCGNLNEVSVK